RASAGGICHVPKPSWGICTPSSRVIWGTVMESTLRCPTDPRTRGRLPWHGALMPRLIPTDPQFTTASEQEVWTLLRDGLGPDDVLIANLRLTDETKDHEADLIALMPDVGIVVIEVKGGAVWH